MSSNPNCTRCRKPKRNCNCIPGTLYAPGGVSDKNWDHNAACNEPYDGLKGASQARKKFACASCSRMIEESPCMFCRKWWAGYEVEEGFGWKELWGELEVLGGVLGLDCLEFGIEDWWYGEKFCLEIGLILNGLDTNCFCADVGRAVGIPGTTIYYEKLGLPYGRFLRAVADTLLRCFWEMKDLSFQFSCPSWPSQWQYHAKVTKSSRII